jgi:hypothetical protein
VLRSGSCIEQAAAPRRLRCRIEPFLDQGGAAARRRWPGVSGGLSLGKARPPHAGPHPSRAQIKEARRQTLLLLCSAIRRTNLGPGQAGGRWPNRSGR